MLRGLDLKLGQGQVVVIQGDNGAGKTTLLRVLAGLLRPTQGKLEWFGTSSLKIHPRIRARLGYMAHDILLYEDLTAYQNLVLFANLYGLKNPLRQVMTALEDAGLWERRADPPRKFSRGMRARLGLARVLIHKPKILLLDEPSSGLDVQGRKWILKALSQQKKDGGASIITTHDPAVWTGLNANIKILDKGKLHPAK